MDGIAEHDVLDLVDGLLEKGVLSRDECDPAQVRYRMPQALRAFGAARSGRGGARRPARAAARLGRCAWSHAIAGAWFGAGQPGISRRLACRAGEPAARARARRPGATARLESPRSSRPAWRRSGWSAGTWPRDGRGSTVPLSRRAPDPLRLRVVLVSTWLAVLQGEGARDASGSRRRADLAPDPGRGSAALERLDGALAALEGRLDDAEDLLHRAIETAVGHDDAQASATGWYLLGCAAWMAGRHDGGRRGRDGGRGP